MSLFPLMAAAAVAAAATSPERTLRVDYLHVGSATEERFALSAIVLEGPWPGPPDRRVDDTNLGKYLFEVLDRGTNRILYSRGFASIYGEWETTAEAKRVSRGFHESIRFPAPGAPVQVVVKKRDAENAFHEGWSILVDPADPAIDRSPPPAAAKLWAVVQNGDPPEKVDLLLLGDGYTAAEMDKWHRDAKRLAEILFATPPFRERRSDFNVWAVDTPADDGGVSRPSDGAWRRTALGASYDIFGSERYVLTFDNERLRRAASPAPADPAERWALAELFEIAFTDGKEGDFTVGQLKGQLSALNEAELCEAHRLLGPARTTETFDTPIVARRFGTGGNIVGWAVYEYARPKPKGKAETCLVRTSTLSSAQSLPPELAAAFLDELARKGLKNVPAPDAEPAPEPRGHELRLWLLGMVHQSTPTNVGFAQFSYDAAQIAFTVTDRAGGRTLLKGRASRMIGKKKEKDIRERASFVTCD